MIITLSILAIVVAIFAMYVRMKAAKKPATIKKIILPPVFMSTGFFMFVFPMFRVNFSEIIESTIIGMILSLLLIKTSDFEIIDNKIFLKRSKAFLYILFGLVFFRFILKLFLSSTFNFWHLSGMFYILAFAMIVPWRLYMVWLFRKYQKQLITTKNI